VTAPAAQSPSDLGNSVADVTAEPGTLTPGLDRRPPAHRPGGRAARQSGLALALVALGVVYGDIGTSPIYALKACFAREYGLAPTPLNVYGVVSLIIWALTITVSIKYVAVIMRADNHGEGGILALLALVRGDRDAPLPRRRLYLVALALFGAALLYGDGVITPAISVLSAVEGLRVASPRFAGLSVPVSAIILFALFAVQRFGVRRVGSVFGPVMLFWFAAIAAFGAMAVTNDPMILRAIDPWYGVRFFAAHGPHGFVILGGVVLAVTGAEALYADMGYFGPGPIRWGWFGLVFPALLLNYAGQGALLLKDPSAVANPFFLLAPRSLLYPYVVLATVATIIASQALISGVFVLTNQAIQLGYAPRLTVVHTSNTPEHVYMPAINRVLMLGCLLLVVTFRSSDALGAAYGIAVTGTMAITTVLFYSIARTQWGWSRIRAVPLCGVFLLVDGAFLGANALKIAHDGWVPLAIAAAVWTLMTTWAWGRDRLVAFRRQNAVPLTELLARLDREKIPRVPGTAVFLTSHPDGAPRVLMRQLDYAHVLASHVVLLRIVFEEIPWVRGRDRISITPLAQGFVRVVTRVGFLQEPDLSAVLAECRLEHVALSAEDTVFYMNAERLIPKPERNPLRRWRKALFIVLLRNSRAAPDFFNLPADRVVEIGEKVPF
jgi:KUP system potassium uptake protein